MKIAVVYLFFLYLLFSCSQAIELKYSLFTSSEGFDTSGAVPAVELAEEMVNKDGYILPGYTLVHEEIKDTKVGIQSTTMQEAIELLLSTVQQGKFTKIIL